MTAAEDCELRVWWIPQMPMEAFHYPVPTVAAGMMLCDALADYDLFQFEHRIKPDYANVGGLQVRHPEHTNGEWWDFSNDEPAEMDELRILLGEPVQP